MIHASTALAADDILSLRSHAERAPQAIALAAPARKSITYGELPQCLREIRRELTGAGFGPGEVAALALPNGPDLVTGFLAVSGIGAGAPLNPALTESEFHYHLERLGARVLVVPEGEHPAAQAVTAARSLGIGVLRIRSGDDAPAGAFSLSTGESARASLPVRRTGAALLLFTSATTGRPKLVPHTWDGLHSMGARDTVALRVTATDRYLSMMPLFHIFGLGAVLTQLSCGGVVCAAPGFQPAAFLAWIEEFQPTWFASVSPMMRPLIRLIGENREAFRRSPLRMIRTTGVMPGPGTLAELENAAGVVVLQGYGLTETSGVTRCTMDGRRPGSVGRSSGLDVAIQDPLGNILAAGLEGEVVIRGASVTAGYLEEPEANQAAFRGGWFHTGDLGRLDGDGFLFLTGRMREIINRGGEKIVPVEVDEALAAHPAVAEAAVFAVSHPTLGEDIAAAVVLREGAAASALDLRKFLSARLTAFKVPRRVVFLAKLPRTALGKPQRALLAAQYQSRSERGPEEA